MHRFIHCPVAPKIPGLVFSGNPPVNPQLIITLTRTTHPMRTLSGDIKNCAAIEFVCPGPNVVWIFENEEQRDTIYGEVVNML